MNFLEKLDYLKGQRGISNNHKLSELCGVPYTTIDNFYRVGYEKVKLSTLQKIADFFAVSLDYLVKDVPLTETDGLVVSERTQELLSIMNQLPDDDQQRLLELARLHEAAMRNQDKNQ